jgi:glycosyltransferase involved in cell wall biosynthesis
MKVTTPVLELRSVLGTGGGPDKTILLGASLLDETRYNTIVCYLRDARDPVFSIDNRARRANVDYVEIRERHSFDWRIWPELVRLVRTRHVRIVHAHDYKTDLLALLLARSQGIIPLSTVHGWSGHGWRETRIYYPADRWLLRRYPHVVAVSSGIRDRLLSAGAEPERVTVILNGIDPSAFVRTPEREPVARAQFDIAAGTPVVGSVGRLESEKNFPLLLRAFSEVGREFPDAILMIAGEGALRPELEAESAALGIAGRVRLPGHVADISRLHHAFDVYVQSSDNEGTPNSILEAMALQTPIVATDVGGTGELARHGREGLLVARRDEAALARAIAETLRNRQGAHARALAARCRVETDLSFQSRMRRIEAVYDQLLAAFPAGQARSVREHA